MEKHASAVQAKPVVVALAGAGSLCWAEASAAEGVVDVDEHEASKREAHQGAAEEQEEEEIVDLGEAEGHVDSASAAYEGIRLGFCWVHHDGVSKVQWSLSRKNGESEV